MLGRALRVEEIPAALARQAILGAMPVPLVGSVLALMRYGASVPEPALHLATPITGRPARSFAEWVAEHRDAFL